IRDRNVTGVQTCALPILTTSATGSETDAPGSDSSFSTLTTSPTATLYCLPPVLTIAYVAIVGVYLYFSSTSRVPLAAHAIGTCAGGGGSVRRAGLDPPGDNWSRVLDQRRRGQTGLAQLGGPAGRAAARRRRGRP